MIRTKFGSIRPPRLPSRLVAVSWRDLLLIVGPVLLIAAVAAWIAFKFLRPAPPDTIVLISGPEGSSYHTFAQRYKKIIENNGVKVQVVTSDGALENLRSLADPKFKIDVGFVQGGLTEGVDISGLESLGSIFEQPLMIFYRSPKPFDRLYQLRGKRLAIGPEGSGARALALNLLKANDMIAPPTQLLDLAGEEAANGLKDGRIDAALLMGDSTTREVLRALLRTPGIRLMDVAQADGYVRRFRYLSKLTLPEGAIDLGKDIPDKDFELIGTTVELVARRDLHPALSDLLIGAARQVHGGPGLFRDAGEFPAPLARDFPISDDAQRYYKSGTQFLYKRLPFWLASLVDRLLVLIVPLVVLILPAVRLVPPLYRWRVRSRIYRWYGALIALEREMLAEHTTEQGERIVERLDQIEEAVNNIRTPLAFADQLYVLRQHIAWVRERLSERRAG